MATNYKMVFVESYSDGSLRNKGQGQETKLRPLKVH